MSGFNEDTQLLLRQYDHAVARFNFESEQQVARNNFFMIFQGVIIAGFISGVKELSNNGSLLLPFFAFVFFLLGLIQAKNAAGAVRMIIVTYSKVADLENKIKSKTGSGSYCVYSGIDASEVMRNERKSAQDQSYEESCIFGGFLERVTLWYVSKNKYVARNNLYAAWVFCFFWFSIFLFFMFKQLKVTVNLI